ncbi:hypothetical protein BDW42DRAFT_173111 [Aspergillus taichungensis]|uniref:Uncharacterized protein n=1 Tax=Aspergillus taichungensis TaxID=482145 RepID=A0A2J5HPY1_9EURO|nr:hypothetical protein BDW42DRAFT_173111 [Aspergillus taichungensis]
MVCSMDVPIDQSHQSRHSPDKMPTSKPASSPPAQRCESTRVSKASSQFNLPARP